MNKLQKAAQLSLILLFSFSSKLHANGLMRLQRLIRPIVEQSESDEHELNFIKNLIQKAHEKETDPFSTTLAFRWEQEKLIHLGDITNLTDKDLIAVTFENFVYIDYLTQVKTRLSGEEYACVGAVVIGTQDTKILDKLRSLVIKSKL